MTRVLVCGGRDYADRDSMWSFLDQCHRLARITVVVHGAAAGADTIADQWAAARNIRRLAYRALWDLHGRGAGPVRNQLMLTDGKPDVVLAAAGGSGTSDMIRRAERAGVPVVRIP